MDWKNKIIVFMNKSTIDKIFCQHYEISIQIY